MMPNMATIIYNLAKTKNLLSKKQEPKSTIPPCNCPYTANCPLNRECRERLPYTKPRSHLETPPNITLGAPKRNLRHIITTILIPLNIEQKEMNGTLQSILDC